LASVPPPIENSDISPISIEDEMKSSYLDYAMSVIVSRALPDVRDGLKPVHRRILYACQEGGFVPGRHGLRLATGLEGEQLLPALGPTRRPPQQLLGRIEHDTPDEVERLALEFVVVERREERPVERRVTAGQRTEKRPGDTAEERGDGHAATTYPRDGCCAMPLKAEVLLGDPRAFAQALDCCSGQPIAFADWRQEVDDARV